MNFDTQSSATVKHSGPSIISQGTSPSDDPGRPLCTKTCGILDEYARHTSLYGCFKTCKMTQKLDVSGEWYALGGPFATQLFQFVTKAAM